MSDQKNILLANFINRRTGKEMTAIPISNRISLNCDMRQLCDSFDFDFLYRREDSIDLESADFVEFYFKIDGMKVQVSCGFIETFVQDTSANQHRFQANGRDFLGQLFNIPFLIANPLAQTSMQQFVKNTCINIPAKRDDDQYIYLNTYLAQYQYYRGVTRYFVDRGAYASTIAVPELTDAKIGPVLQQTIEQVYNVIYLDRFGRVNVYGRDNRYQFDQDLTLSEFDDLNVESMQFRQDFSRVFSECKVLYTGGLNNVDYDISKSSSAFLKNSESDAKYIFNPEVRTFQMSSLITMPKNASDFQNRVNQYCASILRKSNQNLYQFVVRTNKPYFLKNDGTKVLYEKGQVFYLMNESRGFYDEMMLVGIGYTQSETSLEVQLMFVPVDSLI